MHATGMVFRREDRESPATATQSICGLTGLAVLQFRPELQASKIYGLFFIQLCSPTLKFKIIDASAFITDSSKGMSQGVPSSERYVPRLVVKHEGYV